MTARLSCHLQTFIPQLRDSLCQRRWSSRCAHLFQGFVIWTPTIEKSLIEEPRSSRSWRSTLRHPDFTISDPNGVSIVFGQDL
jgi:hypothetical protein